MGADFPAGPPMRDIAGHIKAEPGLVWAGSRRQHGPVKPGATGSYSDCEVIAAELTDAEAATVAELSCYIPLLLRLVANAWPLDVW